MPVRMLPFLVPDRKRMRELDAEIAARPVDLASPFVTVGEFAILRVYREWYRMERRPKGFSRVRKWAREIWSRKL